MFDLFHFRLTQLRAVKIVMDDFASFKPDDQSAADVGATIAEAESVLDAAEGAWTDLNLARSKRDQAAVEGHEAAVGVYAVMKQRYRKDVGSSDAIGRLPVKDRTPEQTLARMEVMSKLWERLPNPPGSLAAFSAWDTMGRTEFDALAQGLRAALEVVDDVGESWSKADGDLKEMYEVMGDFVTTALVQGRAQFPSGSSERSVIDGIPQVERSRKAPGPVS